LAVGPQVVEHVDDFLRPPVAVRIDDGVDVAAAGADKDDADVLGDGEGSRIRHAGIDLGRETGRQFHALG